MVKQKAIEGFREQFGCEPTWVAMAPGRVNLIGEHTDYNGGFVFPAAIDRFVALAAAPSAGLCQLVSDQAGAGEPFDAQRVMPGELTGWSRYPAGVAWALRERGLAPSAIQAYVSSDLPMGSGVSSSAAIELAFATLWNAIGAFGMSGKQLALLSQKAENDFVGVRCGAMDQLASALGEAGKALFIDTRSLDVEAVPLPAGVEIVICDTNTSRELAGSAYNVRRSECEEAARIMGVRSLRDATLELLQQCSGTMALNVFQRARHVITENARAIAFREALWRSEFDKIGTLMAASHASLRDDYEVSSAALDSMVDACLGAPGCIGVRMTGAGFGGACVALVNSSQAVVFLQSASDTFDRKRETPGIFTRCSAAHGARADSRSF